MIIEKRASLFGTGTRMQMERWDDGSLKIAVYPKVKKESPTQPFRSVGDEIRVVLDKNFKNEDAMYETYWCLAVGRETLKSCEPHFHSTTEAKALGILA